MNTAFGDIFNRGKYAVYVSNISEDGILIQGNNLWVPKEGTSGDGLQYENLARDFGVELGGWSFGAQFGDFNNDGTSTSTSPTDTSRSTAIAATGTTSPKVAGRKQHDHRRRQELAGV